MNFLSFSSTDTFCLTNSEKEGNIKGNEQRCCVRMENVKMSEQYGNDLVTVVDDEGNQHQFEILDAIETDDARYVVLVPVYDNPSDLINDDGELVILTVKEENGEDLLLPIEDDDEFEEIADIFEERLADLYEVEELEGE